MKGMKWKDVGLHTSANEGARMSIYVFFPFILKTSLWDIPIEYNLVINSDRVR
jgi:hypothetical protein